jgi:class 3 adenylate cyclase/tetratricopeptide (TPR) repeat protein
LADKILATRSSIEGERRTVTVLFADAAGFTPISERLGEEQVYSLMQGCFARMMDAVHRYDGTVTQFLGDGIMALFGAPIAHEDSPRRAVTAALEMQGALSEYAVEVKKQHQIECRFRAGLNTGPVVVGKISDNLDMDYTALGDTVNLAARMAEVAKPGTVYLTANTHRVVEDYIECEPLGALEIKGKTQRVTTYRAIREKAVRTRLEAAAQRGLTAFAGRDRELQMLEGFLEQAREGQGQVVFLSGEAGIGKSRLLYEFQDTVREEDISWLEGRCTPYGKNIPYLPIIEIIKQNFRLKEGDNDAKIIEKVNNGVVPWDDAARRNVPHLKYLLNVDPGDPAVAAMDSIARRAGILDAIRALFTQESRRKVVIVVVEDLQWIDEQSEQALAALISAISSSPIMLILTHRPGYVGLLRERAQSSLVLKPLQARDSRVMVLGVLRVAALPEQLEQMILGKAEGNPFYIEEVGKSLLEAGVLRRTNGTYVLGRPAEEVLIPDTIQGVILSRIDRLERQAKEALQLASVIGREFTVRLLQRISDSRTELNNLLAQLNSLELIYEKAFFPELSYMFKHALTHQVAYSTLLLERRKTLHRLVATGIEELYSDRLPEMYEMLAHHYYESEEWRKALDYSVKAARKSAGSFANQEAMAYFDQALQAFRLIGDAPPEVLMDIYGGKAEVSLTISDWKGVVNSYSSLREAAREAGRAALEGMGLAGMAYGHVWTHQFDLAETEAREALVLSERAQNSAIRTVATYVLAELQCLRGNLKTGLETGLEVARMSRETNQPLYETLNGLFLAINYSWRGFYEEAHRIAAESVATSAQHNMTIPLVFNKWNQGLALAGYGRYDDAITILKDTVALCQRMGDAAVQSRALNTLGWIYGELGAWDQAKETNQKALDLATALGDPEILTNARINLADCAFALGQKEQARKDLEQLYASLPQLQEWMKWRYSQHLRHSLGEVLSSLGEQDAALRLADECLALADRTESRKNIVKARRLRGQIFLARGQLDEADAELGLALETALKISNPPQVWKTYAALGDLRNARGRLTDAKQAYEDAQAIIQNVAGGLQDPSLRESLLNSPLAKELHVKTGP